jgi:hypothetical protein
MAATFENVYTNDGLQVPWYITGGPPDWAGNLTGARRAAGSPLGGLHWGA